MLGEVERRYGVEHRPQDDRSLCGESAVLPQRTEVVVGHRIEGNALDDVLEGWPEKGNLKKRLTNFH